MNFLKRLFSSAPAPESDAPPNDEDQAVLVWIDSADLGGSEETVDDLATLEDEIQEALGDAGEVDGHDLGASDATVYCYGPDANEMFELIRPTLEQNSLSRKAQVTIRYGGPDTDQQRVVKLGG